MLHGIPQWQAELQQSAAFIGPGAQLWTGLLNTFLLICTRAPVCTCEPGASERSVICKNGLVERGGSVVWKTERRQFGVSTRGGDFR